MTLVQFRVVMPGLVQVKPAHADLGLVRIERQEPLSVSQTALRFRGNDGTGGEEGAWQTFTRIM